MRCLACDLPLSEKEDERRFSESGERVGLCNACVVGVDVPMVLGQDVVNSELPDLSDLEAGIFVRLEDLPNFDEEDED